MLSTKLRASNDNSNFFVVEIPVLFTRYILLDKEAYTANLPPKPIYQLSKNRAAGRVAANRHPSATTAASDRTRYGPGGLNFRVGRNFRLSRGSDQDIRYPDRLIVFHNSGKIVG